MKTKTSTRIEPGELTTSHGSVYLAATLIADKPCSEQCSMYDTAAGKCSGFCYRWDNGDDVVFRYLLPTDIVAKNAVMVKTPDLITEKIEIDTRTRISARNAAVYRARKRGEYVPKPKKGPRPRGGIEQRKTSYRAAITIAGVVYRYTSKSLEDCQQWLDLKRKEVEDGR